MSTLLRVQFVAILLLTVLALTVVVPFPNKPSVLSGVRINPGLDLAGGAEIRYTVLFEPGSGGDRKKTTREATDVLRRRLESRQLREPKVTSVGDDGIAVQLAGIDGDELREIKKLISGVGKLRL